VEVEVSAVKTLKEQLEYPKLQELVAYHAMTLAVAVGDRVAVPFTLGLSMALIEALLKTAPDKELQEFIRTKILETIAPK
jgi:hypothetical protein